ncbi:general secretion pathway protein D [Pseudomonas sp. SLBN-26]|uniref:General secretion pathway protein D n=1 Tax=Metapseudomonas otitidis TaxID=319939 RepID=A0A1I0T9R8_9GAMM|nr:MULTISPECIES: type II secretion system secretin GspD [Pseudomonas]KIV68031.1 General secretion pathway protein D [Pseudomonas sp. FeS53a]MBO2925685.1 type II secretion system secretin GspD [Pseudomonas otitidis]MCP1621203.1 general secretion pathway protein D [Pseudomonas otitidis]MDH0337384.1 type II secretion system secretin GspD [Pseudomonas otitidis]MDH1106863.1 type II secretion system secretin GspD [Pseudomonas otitidis]
MPTALSRLSIAVLVAGLATAPLPVFAAEPVSASSSSQQDSWTINLKDADIREFVDQVADITGQTFIVDPRVKGQVSVVSKAPLSLSEVYQLFLSVMATHGFTVITQGDQARIIPNAEAKAEAGSGPEAPDTLETRVIQVQHAPVTELIPLIRPLVPQYGHLAAVTSANALIISDRAANIARIEDLMRQLDQKGDRDYTVLNLQNAWVMDAAEVLNNAVTRGQAKGTNAAQVIADSRTNRLIIVGPPSARAKLVSLAQSLDTPTARSANTRVIRLRHNDAKALATTLGEISEGLKSPEGTEQKGKPQNILIRADESLNALVLLAEPDTVNALEDIVRQLDVPRAQVMVEAAIVEISGDISDALGVQWAVDARGRTGGLGGANFANTGLSVGTVLKAIQDKKVPDSLPDGAIIGVGTDHFGALVTALSANSKSNLLSTPSLLTLDNQKAEILVGQNVPFQTGSYTTGSTGASNPFTTIERKDIGVTLKVTPHINEGATLRLEIEQEISSIAPTASVSAQAVDLITNKRSIKSTILAEDGQVIVLGGLIQDDITTTDSKVPLLGDIPLLGRLFRSTKDSHVKRNLMVFLRPTVVRDRAGLAALSGKKYSDIRVLGDPGPQRSRPSILPSEPAQLFDGQGTPAIDLRP